MVAPTMEISRARRATWLALVAVALVLSACSTLGDECDPGTHTCVDGRCGNSGDCSDGESCGMRHSNGRFYCSAVCGGAVSDGLEKVDDCGSLRCQCATSTDANATRWCLDDRDYRAKCGDCTRDADCQDGEVCLAPIELWAAADTTCFPESDLCSSAADCKRGEHCLAMSDGRAVCRPRPECECGDYLDGCFSETVCGVDHRCRMPCDGPSDCAAGETCSASRTCATSAELDETGELRDARSQPLCDPDAGS